MQVVLVSLAVLAALAFGVQAFVRANPAKLAKLTRLLGGLVLSGLALMLLARGQAHLAFILLGVGFPLLFAGGGRWFGSKPKASGQTSKVQTAHLQMSLDHDSGAMAGKVLAGPYAGRQLADLAMEDLRALLLECRASDPQSLALMEAYLDNRHPDWRETMDQANGDSGEAGAGAASVGAMTKAEARRLLGVGPMATDEEIRTAWREQMKRNHPDQGGSAYLAAKINEAKEVLLGRNG